MARNDRPGGAISIKDLRHFVAVCSAKDTILDGATIRLARQDVYHAWACIKESRGSQFAHGAAILESRDVKSHTIYMRYKADVDITASAWLFDQRGISTDRWFKILRVADYEERGLWWKFDCRLVEKGDDLTQPTPDDVPKFGGAQPLPNGVRF